MKRFLLLLVLLNCSGICLAASFDCAKAKTDIEKQICGNPELSELDSKLGATYFIHRDKDGLGAEQKHWLKQVRDACTDQACLKKVYTDRIDAIDPLADGVISCENIRQYPERIFTDAIDLGSGSISPIEVDYACPESLASLPFLKKLLDLTELIRHEEQDQLCVGTIVRALRRYYYFNLAESGFAPQLLIKQLPSDSSARQAKVLGYFQQWAEKSSYNLTMHRQYFSEFEKVLPLLVEHYKNHLKLSETQASAAARYALMGLVYRAAGA
ncbi:MAG: lysozyme inhibitor LprI family protein, partial [Methylomonas sp.]